MIQAIDEPPPPPATRDSRRAIVISTERSRIAELDQGTYAIPSVYQRGRHVLRHKTQGLIQVSDEAEVSDMIESAGITPRYLTYGGMYITMQIQESEIPRLAAVAAQQGIDYIIVVEDFVAHAKTVYHKKMDRLKLIGGLGISYSTEGPVTEVQCRLDITVWRCKTGMRLFSQSFQNSSGGGLRERFDINEWLGLAVVQRLTPEFTGTERNPVIGDYKLNIRNRTEVRMWRTEPVISGTTGRSFPIEVVSMTRQGDHILLEMPIKNPFDERLEIRFGDVFCLDKNGGRYELIETHGELSAVIDPDKTHKIIYKFKIPDRNVDFLNLHIKSHINVPPDYYADTTLSWANIPLFPDS